MITDLEAYLMLAQAKIAKLEQESARIQEIIESLRSKTEGDLNG